jgi:hypothetical protein
MTMSVRPWHWLSVAPLLLTAGIHCAEGAEGAASHYLPGTAGELGLALAPEPGLLVANTLWLQSGEIGRAVLQGRVSLDLDVTTVLDLVAASYTFERPVLGGTYSVATLVPFGHANLDAFAMGPAGGTLGASGDNFNLSDIALVPLQLNWTVGRFSFELMEAIIAPTGAYDVDRAVNLGRNYWSFDTVGAATWLNADTGTEVSLAPGIMVNTKNDDTEYRTGAEFHLDLTANQFLSETFAIGLRGYVYQQVSGDSGDGAVLGGFESDAVEVGPGFFWTPGFGGGQIVVQGKWLHDFGASNRFESDYGLLTVARQF